LQHRQVQKTNTYYPPHSRKDVKSTGKSKLVWLQGLRSGQSKKRSKHDSKIFTHPCIEKNSISVTSNFSNNKTSHGRSFIITKFYCYNNRQQDQHLLKAIMAYNRFLAGVSLPSFITPDISFLRPSSFGIFLTTSWCYLMDNDHAVIRVTYPCIQQRFS
jgi:hypothetical protein